MSKTLDYRVAVGLDYPALTEAFIDGFDSDVPFNFLDKRNWIYTEFGGPPVMFGGKVSIQLHGGSCREFFVTRPHLFPRDLTKKFTISFTVKFPAPDPVFSAIVTVGTLSSVFGTDGDPLRIVQHGSTREKEIGTDELGRLYHQINGTFPGSDFNDQGSHDYVIQYDPAGSPVLLITRDSVPLYSDTSAGVQPRPYYVMFGFLLRDEKLSKAQQIVLNNGGTTANPTPLPIIEVSYFSITCDSYETRTYPTWTTANAGGTTFDNAAAGERVLIDGETWAIIPKSQIASVHTTVGRSLSQPNDVVSLDLLAPLASNPDATPYVFRDDMLARRPVIVDSRIGEDVGATWTDWRRHICGILESKERDDVHVRLAGRDRPSAKLDTFFARGYFDVDIDTGVQDGATDGARSGLLLSQIFNDLVDVADALYGDKLGATETLMRLIDQAPQMISSGGGALLSVLQEWVDRAAQEMWREYDVSGDARYGRLRSNLTTLGGTSVYTFRGYGTTNPNILTPGVRFVQDVRRGPGQAYYRNDSPAGAFEGLNLGKVPVLGIFPTHQYPPTDRIVNDSYGPFADFALSSLVSLRDKDDNIVNGGVAMHRYRAENSTRRSVEFSVIGHNWMQPSQIITIDDEDGTGITTAETWVIDNIDTTIERGTLRARILATSTDWLNAIRQTM